MSGTAVTGAQVAAPCAAGPSVYVPAPKVEAPPEDVKTFDARRLTLHQPASNDVRSSIRDACMLSCDS